VSTYKSTKIIGVAQLTQFFVAVDKHLTTSAKIVIIGGSAAAFHGATSMTNDVDTFEQTGADLENAIERAREETGLSIPISPAGVAQIPYNSEDRFDKCLPQLKKLEVFILERHDLALSKTLRGHEHDEQQIKEIHQANPLDFDILVPRFKDEMLPICVGDPARIRAQFLDLIEQLFGGLHRARAEKMLRR